MCLEKLKGIPKLFTCGYAKATDLVNVLQGLSKTAVIGNQQGKAKLQKNRLLPLLVAVLM